MQEFETGVSLEMYLFLLYSLGSEEITGCPPRAWSV